MKQHTTKDEGGEKAAMWSCRRCGAKFFADWLDEDSSPICDDCFKILKAIDNPLDYQKFMKECK